MINLFTNNIAVAKEMIIQLFIKNNISYVVIENEIHYNLHIIRLYDKTNISICDSKSLITLIDFKTNKHFLINLIEESSELKKDDTCIRINSKQNYFDKKIQKNFNYKTKQLIKKSTFIKH